MKQIGLLKPEQAAKLAIEKVATFKREQERKAAEARLAEKRKPAKKPAPAVETPNASPLPINKAELTAQLLESAKEGDKGEVARLLKAGADVDSKDSEGWTALMWAVPHGHMEIAQILVDAGANVNARGDYGTTVLMCAAERRRNDEMIEFLINRGAKVNEKDKYGKTVLDQALDNKFFETADLLKRYGAKLGPDAP